MSRTGVTMLELMVALAILGIAASAVGFSVAQVAMSSGDAERITIDSAIADGRHRAIRDGVPVSITLTARDRSSADSSPASQERGRILTVLAMPDGTVLAPESLGIDRLTGIRIPQSESVVR